MKKTHINCSLPLFLLLVSLLTTATAAEATAQDVFEIEKVCMNTESMMQDHILIGMKITYGDPAKDIAEKKIIVEAFLNDVNNHHMKDKFHNEIQKVVDLWVLIKPRLTEEATLEESIDLRNQVATFVDKCIILGEHLAKAQGSDASQIIVLIGDMGIEVQKISVDYLLKAWGHKDSHYYDEIKRDIALYDDLHHRLNEIEEVKTNEVIKQELKFIDKNFLVFKFMAQSKSGRYVPLIASKNSSKIIEHILNIVDLEGES